MSWLPNKRPDYFFGKGQFYETDDLRALLTNGIAGPFLQLSHILC